MVDTILSPMIAAVRQAADDAVERGRDPANKEENKMTYTITNATASAATVEECEA